jgi:hypothetical protein
MGCRSLLGDLGLRSLEIPTHLRDVVKSFLDIIYTDQFVPILTQQETIRGEPQGSVLKVETYYAPRDGMIGGHGASGSTVTGVLIRVA